MAALAVTTGGGLKSSVRPGNMRASRELLQSDLDNLSVDLVAKYSTADSGTGVMDASDDTTFEYLFMLFVKKYGKSYSTTEYARRFTIFKQNVNFMLLSNSGGTESIFKLDINEYADMTYDEMRGLYMGVPPVNPNSTDTQSAGFVDFADLGTSVMGDCTPTPTPTPKPSPNPNPTPTPSPMPDPNNPPASWDWRTKSVVTPVENQGGCGSCWAYSAAAALEAAYAIKYGKQVVLSKQKFVDCAKPGNYGCSGGWPSSAFGYAKTWGGVPLQSAYTYTGRDGTCKSPAVAPNTKPSGYETVAANNEDALLKSLLKGPVAVLLEASSAWMFYKKGVFDGTCGYSLNHAVTLVGYGTDSATGLKYWLVKNSWGTGYGESGYIRMRRYGGSNRGKCGIAMTAVRPIL